MWRPFKAKRLFLLPYRSLHGHMFWSLLNWRIPGFTTATGMFLHAKSTGITKGPDTTNAGCSKKRTLERRQTPGHHRGDRSRDQNPYRLEARPQPLQLSENSSTNSLAYLRRLLHLNLELPKRTRFTILKATMSTTPVAPTPLFRWLPLKMAKAAKNIDCLIFARSIRQMTS